MRSLETRTQAGAVSTLHFDKSPSVLVQVRGRKRMLFFRPSDLPCLEPRPLNSPLRRRCAIDVAGHPDTAALLNAHPSMVGVEAFEAVLEEGDAVTFPG